MRIFAQSKPILKMGESRGIITIDLLPHYPDRAVERSSKALRLLSPCYLSALSQR